MAVKKIDYSTPSGKKEIIKLRELGWEEDNIKGNYVYMRKLPKIKYYSLAVKENGNIIYASSDTTIAKRNKSVSRIASNLRDVGYKVKIITDKGAKIIMVSGVGKKSVNSQLHR
jgi:hypothetical protein